jgi:hypothetical protein
MNNPDFFSRIGVTPFKLALIVTLAVTLVVVLAVNFSGDNRASNETLASDLSREVKSTKRALASPAKSAAKKSTKIKNENLKKGRGVKFRSHKVAGKESGKEDGDLANVDSVGGSIPWAQITVSEMESVSPFGVPEEIERIRLAQLEEDRQKAQAEKEAKLQKEKDRKKQQVRMAIERMQKSGVKMIYINGKERVAVIGDRTVRVNDEFDGVRVTAITENGTVVVNALEADSTCPFAER